MTTPHRIGQLTSKYRNSNQPPLDYNYQLGLQSSYVTPDLLVPNPISIHRHNPLVRSRTNSIAGSRVTVTHNPAIIERITATPRVYEIVQPIIEVTPTMISQTKVDRKIINNSQNRQLEIAIKGVEVDDVPSPPPLNLRRRSRSRLTKRECREKYCGCWDHCMCCSWWVCCLLLLLLLIPLIALGFTYLKKRHMKKEIDVVVQPIEFMQQNREYVNKIQSVLNKNRLKDKLKQQQLTPQTNPTIQINKTKQLVNTVHPPFNNSNENNKQIITISDVKCPTGYFMYGKKCLSCPDQSMWNGTACIKRIYILEGQNILSSNTKNKNNNKGIQSDPDIYVASAWSVVQPKKHLLQQ